VVSESGPGKRVSTTNQPVRLAYQATTSNTFFLEQTNHQQ
jgi:hypothetical protein